MMENPEEVLQALDEFQKMRPSEIPRELEDYLCWVARTGDPVYQWNLIKALFREKLTRVMTEFYESCPTLDLAPCPNVEQFNYDIMKRNLLERLESFANAPFTVQRICELLTTPKKEYNRIDKFMRAIEKNILVVSTREPGLFGRRSENGDSLVNGSVEDETSHHGQASECAEGPDEDEVEMENWVKDCTAATVVPMHTENSEEMSVENGLNSPLKTPFAKHENRTEIQMSSVDTTTTSYISNSVEFSTTTTITSQVLVQESSSVVQNLTTTNQEPAPVVGDVADAIINEDTSSQPSLELENDDNDSSDSKKLQTTFQAKDFTLDEDKSPKAYSEENKTDKPEESVEDTDTSKECEQSIQSMYSNEKLLNESTDDEQSSIKPENIEVHSIINENDQVDKTPVTELQDSEKCDSESNVSASNFTPVNNNLDTKENAVENETVGPTDNAPELAYNTDAKVENKSNVIVSNSLPDVTDPAENSVKQLPEEIDSDSVNKVIQPTVEEPSTETTESSNILPPESTELTIEETAENDSKPAKSIVPDPIPIVEEPKDSETVAKDWDRSVLINEVAGEPQAMLATVKNGLEELPTKSEEMGDDQMVTSGCEEATSNKEPAELMDVDNEALVSSVQQDEPMEQETTEVMTS